jgi:hypothetical protein
MGWLQESSVMKPGLLQKDMKDHSPRLWPFTHIGTCTTTTHLEVGAQHATFSAAVNRQ